MRKRQSVGKVRNGLLAAWLVWSVAGCGERPAPPQDSLRQARDALAARQYQTAGIALKTYLQVQPVRRVKKSSPCWPAP